MQLLWTWHSMYKFRSLPSSRPSPCLVNLNAILPMQCERPDKKMVDAIIPQRLQPLLRLLALAVLSGPSTIQRSCLYVAHMLAILACCNGVKLV